MDGLLSVLGDHIARRAHLEFFVLASIVSARVGCLFSVLGVQVPHLAHLAVPLISRTRSVFPFQESIAMASRRRRQGNAAFEKGVYNFAVQCYRCGLCS